MNLLLSHIKEVYGFIPAKRIWGIIREVDYPVLLAVVAVCLYYIVDCTVFFISEMMK